MFGGLTGIKSVIFGAYAERKLGFLSDTRYMRHKGFVTADTAEPYFELLEGKVWSCAIPAKAAPEYESKLQVAGLQNQNIPTGG